MPEHLAPTRPPRCVLVNVTSGDAMECMFNPTQFTEKLRVSYSRLTVPGLSHQVLQFQNTDNRQLTGVEFYLDRFLLPSQADGPDILAFREFLRALTLPRATEGAPSAPPRVLVVWSGVLTVEAVVSDVEFQYRQFGVDGQVLIYTATVSFEEIVDTRILSDLPAQEP